MASHAAPPSTRQPGSSRAQGVVMGGSRGRGSSAAVLVVALAACSLLLLVPPVVGQAYKPATMEEAIDAAMYLTQFKAGLRAAGLLAALQAPGYNGTVFAPTDLAMQTYLQAKQTTLEQVAAQPEALKELLSFHIVPDVAVVPLSALRTGLALPTAAASGAKLYIRRDVPGIIHVWGVEKPEQDPLNFGTILQFQEIRGESAVLYVIDRVLTPPAQPPVQALSGP